TGGTVNNPCATPTFAPPAGTYTSAQSVVISTTTPGATIYYTTDGTNPNKNSVVYSAPIAISQDTTLRAMCEAPGFTDSIVGVAIYDINIPVGDVAPPVPNPAAGTQDNDFLLALTTSTPAATICFTLDGSTPVCTNGVCQGTSQTYNAQTQVPINGNVTNASTGEVTVNALACKAGGGKDGAMPAQKYTLKVATPALNTPAPGTWDFVNSATGNDQSPLLSSATNGAVTGRFTTAPAAAPNCVSGQLVNGGNNLPTNWSFDSKTGAKKWSFVACKAGYAGSDPYTAEYKFKLNAPTHDKATGTYNNTVTVAIAQAANSSAVGEYTCTTTDGSAPTCGANSTCGGTGAKNAGTVSVTKTGTNVQSVACGPGFEPSDVTSTTYTLQLEKPVFNPATGTPVNANNTLSVSIGPGAGANPDFICYSTTAANPDCTCTATGLAKVTAPIVVSGGTTVKALACKADYLSASDNATYQAANKMANPTITPGTSTQNNVVNTTFKNNDVSQGAIICYTTDGTDPGCTGTCVTVAKAGTGDSAVVNNLATQTNTTIKARACDSAAPDVKTNSDVVTALYTLKVATPTLNTGIPAPGSVPIGTTIAWDSATSTTTSYYTTDGSTPNCTGGSGIFGKSVQIVDPAKTVIKAISCRPNFISSDVATFTYSYFIATPVLSQATATLNDYFTLGVTNPPSSAVGSNRFCYTLDGSNPTCTGGICGFGSSNAGCNQTSCSIDVKKTETVKVIACNSTGLANSAQASASYTLNVGPIAWTPDPATIYSTPQSVSWVPNPAPTALSTGYTWCWAKGTASIPPQPITCAGLEAYLEANSGNSNWTCGTKTDATANAVGTVSTTTTVHAVACKEGMTWSPSTKTYVLNPYSHTIVVDGAKDFNAADALAGMCSTWPDQAYLSWDATRIYFGWDGTYFSAGEIVSAYFGDGVQGTNVSDTPTRTVMPGAKMLYHLRWQNTNLNPVLRKWNVTTSVWENSTIPVVLGYTGGTGGPAYVEFSFLRSDIGNPSNLRFNSWISSSGGFWITGTPCTLPGTMNSNSFNFDLTSASTPSSYVGIP
ncbi:MAG: chitobiase/beta-hexosaminidase C-terminal domain-containing protein, partial [Myxococcales bacterium]|nr:chitobiase/beta-hexosaminidase C-terminal domain-containing protein [Myxococcales bacterium]